MPAEYLVWSNSGLTLLTSNCRYPSTAKEEQPAQDVHVSKVARNGIISSVEGANTGPATRRGTENKQLGLGEAFFQTWVRGRRTIIIAM